MEQFQRLIMEEPEVRAKRLCDKLCGLMKDEIAAYGGAEGFMRWVRYDEEPKHGINEGQP